MKPFNLKAAVFQISIDYHRKKIYFQDFCQINLNNLCSSDNLLFWVSTD